MAHPLGYKKSESGMGSDSPSNTNLLTRSVAMSAQSTRRYGVGNHRPVDPTELGRLLEIDSDSPSGLRWKSRRGGTVAGWQVPRGYWSVKVHGVEFKAHRVVWALSNKLDPGESTIDHIDRNPANNTPKNLRVCTRSQNGMNQACRAGTASPFVGVTWKRRNRRWQARITTASGQVYLGIYVAEHEAARAYDRAAIAGHGEFAHLNFPISDYVETH